MLQEAEIARNDYDALQKRVNNALQESASSKLYNKALMDRNQAHRYLQVTKQLVQQQRRGFLEESRNFRSTIKRLKLTSCATDVSEAFLQIHGSTTASRSSEDFTGDDEHNERGKEHDTAANRELVEDECHKQAMAISGMEDSHEDDVELHVALLAYQRAYQARAATEHAFNNAMEAFTEIQDQVQQRQSKQAVLQQQLERIRATVQQLEGEMQETEEQTRECQALAESYRQRAQHQQPKMESTKNPYSSASSNSKRKMDAVQHPHLTGRVRMDRQFGATGITIQEEDSDNDEESIDVFGPFHKK